MVFRRPRHTRRTLEALARNAGAAETDLWVFSDGAASPRDAGAVAEVRAICRAVRGFRSLRMVERLENWGLARSVRAGVDEVLAEQQGVIVLEDDLLTHPRFLFFMNKGLRVAAADPRILSVSGYMPPRWWMPRPRGFCADVWLSLRNLSFGWGVMAADWCRVDWEGARRDDFPARPGLQEGFARGGADLPEMMRQVLRGELDSWAVPFSYAHFRSGCFSLLPADSYVKPIGFDGTGLHCRPNPLRWLERVDRARPDPVFPERLEPDLAMQEAFRRGFDRMYRLQRLAGAAKKRPPAEGGLSHRSSDD